MIDSGLCSWTLLGAMPVEVRIHKYQLALAGQTMAGPVQPVHSTGMSQLLSPFNRHTLFATSLIGFFLPLVLAPREF